MIRFQILKSSCSVSNTGSLNTAEYFAFKIKIRNYTPVCDYPKSKDLFRHRWHSDKGHIEPRWASAASQDVLITGIRALPPTRRKRRNAARLSLFGSGVLQGEKKKHDEQHGEEICAQMRMWKNLDEERETISFRRSVVKLVLPQQSESSREPASGWL